MMTSTSGCARLQRMDPVPSTTRDSLRSSTTTAAVNTAEHSRINIIVIGKAGSSEQERQPCSNCSSTSSTPGAPSTQDPPYSRTALRSPAAVVSLILTSSLVLYLMHTTHHWHPGYSHDAWAHTRHPNWMSQLCDSVRISQLSLPGTHDSMTYSLSDLEVQRKCQSMSLEKQLYSGIRVLDIRCRHYHDTCQLHHGVADLDFNLDDVLRKVTLFLDTHPREAVLMRVKDKETRATGNTRSFEVTLQQYIARYPRIWQYTGTNNPTLGELRGKIAILQNFDATSYHGIPYSPQVFDIQDNYRLTTNWDLYDKWEAVKEQLDKATSGPQDHLFINYLSGTGGSFPYFVASGKAAPGTHAPRLITGAVASRGDGILSDFPRVACLWKVCPVVFEGTNILTSQWLVSSRSSSQACGHRRVGIIMSDFPGPGLIDQILEHNNSPALTTRCGLHAAGTPGADVAG